MADFTIMNNCVLGVTTNDDGLSASTGQAIRFERFAMGIYSDDFDIAAAICGITHNQNVCCIDTWEPGDETLRDWALSWHERLGKISPIRCNESGMAAVKIAETIGLKTRKRESDIKPIELKLELSEIKGELYQDWKRLRERTAAALRRREPLVAAAAVVMAGRAVKSIVGMPL